MNTSNETIKEIGLNNLLPFQGHPFLVQDDDQMRVIVESIRSVGVLVPAIVRPLDSTFFEIIAGHRRKRACEILGLPTMPCIIRSIDRDAAIVIMVDSNFQREKILPSEKARAYKMKLEAIKRQGARTDLTSDQVGQKLNKRTSRDLISENSPDSSSQIQRYLRLNELIPELLDMVDKEKIALTPAFEISFLTKEEQAMLFVTIESEQSTPSLSQAQRMKKMSRDKSLTEEMILKILTEQKKPEAWSVSLPMRKISRYFPPSFTPQKMEETIIKLLEMWSRMNNNKNN